jgi:hypothetical protein
MMEVLNSSETSVLTAQGTPFFIVTAVKTSNLTNQKSFVCATNDPWVKQESLKPKQHFHVISLYIG